MVKQLSQWILLAILITAAAGCAGIGALAHALPQTEKAKYAGLAGQSVGVMTWADRGVTIDWPSIQLDLSSAIQESLKQSKAKELKGATYPVQAASIVRYQRDHPEVEAIPITDVAAKLGVSRLIYIEVQNLQTRSDVSLQMFRGNITATLQILEIANGKAKVAYQETDVHVGFPPKVPEEGVVNSNDVVMYYGTLKTLAQEIVYRVTTHDVDD